MKTTHPHRVEYIDTGRLGILAALLFWLFDSALQAPVIKTGTDVLHALTSGTPLQLMMRFTVCVFLVVLGFSLRALARRSVEEAVKALIENSTDAYLTVDRRWQIAHINSRALQLLGAAEDPDKKATLWDRHPELSSFFHTQLHHAMSHEAETTVTGYYPPTAAWIEIRAYPTEHGLSLFIHDITAEHTLADDNRRLQAILDNLSDGIIAINRKGVIKSFNKAAEKIFGFRAGEAIGNNVSMLMPADTARMHDSYVQHYVNTGEPKIVGIGPREVTAKRKDGTTFPLDLGVGETYVGDELMFVGITRDVTKRIQERAALEHASNYDVLTGLPNRTLLTDRLTHALSLANRTKQRVAVMFLDLDGFKPVNDTMGHEAGDQLLRDIAQRIKFCVRSCDTVARWGGDEFVVVLEGLHEPEQSARVAQAIINGIKKTFNLHGREASVGVSIGIAIYPNHGQDVPTLVKAADDAMYQAKKLNRGGYCYCEAD